MIPTSHAVGDHRGEECGGFKCGDLAIRTDRVRGHDGISPEAARAIKKAIAGLEVGDVQQTVAAAGLHRRDTMVCHIGVKAITPLCVDQAQSISVDHECRLCPVPATEKGETVMPSCDEGTMQTGGHRAGTDYDV